MEIFFLTTDLACEEDQTKIELLFRKLKKPYLWMLSKEGQVHNEKLAIITEEIILPENACSLILKNKLLAYSNV